MDPVVADDAATTARILASLAHSIERIVARNDRLSPVATEAEELRRERRLSGQGLAAFQGVRTPDISVGSYLQRIERYTKCSASCFVVGFVYIDRASHRNPSSPVVSLNVHRLILTSVLIASKVLDDMHHNNAFFAKVGGVSNSELNRMEIELLFLLDFGVVVTSRIFDNYCWYLEKEMMLCDNKAVVEGKGKVGVQVDDSELNGSVVNICKLMTSVG